ncbi:hypothetical protein TNCV_575231 [Trichonephila clavipes]|nr:hypothetical protein TNCV_575231 [Trichonephila clavipes]
MPFNSFLSDSTAQGRPWPSRSLFQRFLIYGDAAVVKRWNVLLNKSIRVFSSQPPSVGVACFHLLTGHDYLQKHLYHIGVKDSACCQQEEMNGDHLGFYPIVLKSPEDNSTDAHFKSFIVHHFIGLLVN